MMTRDELLKMLAQAMQLEDDQLRGFAACVMANMVEESCVGTLPTVVFSPLTTIHDYRTRPQRIPHSACNNLDVPLLFLVVSIWRPLSR